jgi:serine/threonine-protein kinase
MSADNGAKGQQSPTEPSFVGRVLSQRYRVDELIATGGMGAVYRGEHLRMRKRVAIKVLLPAMANTPHLVARFEREAVAGAHVRHANVAAATDFGQEPDGTCFLVLEYARGDTLSEILKRGPVQPWRAARIVRALADALHAVHEAGIVHRDIKPRNVIVHERPGNDVVKLVDFGLARVQEERLSIIATPEEIAAAAEGELPGARVVTEAGVVVGTVAYMAPEAAQGMDAVDGRSDLYALGIIFYEMLAGLHPFTATEAIELFAAQRHELPPPIRRRAPEVQVPPPLEAIAMRLIEKDPNARYQTGLELAAAIDAAWSQAPRGEAPPEIPGPPSGSPSRAGSMPVQAAPVSAQPTKPLPARTEMMLQAPQIPTEQPKKALPARTEFMMRAPDVPADPFPVRSERPQSPGLMRLRDPRPGGGGKLRGLLARAGVDELPGAALVAGGLVLLTGVVLIAVAVSGDSADAKAEGDTGAAATSTASAGSAKEVPIEVDGVDAAGWRARLKSAVDTKEHGRGVQAVLALVTLEPAAFAERDLRAAAVAHLVGAEFDNNQRMDEVWKALSERGGVEGLEVVYDVVRTRGGTKAARRAVGILRSSEVAARIPVDMRMAFELRTAPCDQRKAILARAGNEGEARVLAELTLMREADCDSDEPCCFRDTKVLADAIKQLKAKAGK